MRPDRPAPLPDLGAEFPRTGDAPIYCNAAATGPLPARTVRVLDEWTRLRAEPWRITLEDEFGTLATARARCAALIGATPDEIAIVPNTSTALNVAAQVLPIPRDRVVLGHDGEFPANVYPWMAMRRHGGPRLEQLPLADGLPDHDALVARLDRGDVGAVAISWVSFVSGDRADLARIGTACRARGIWFVVDAIQGVGAAPLDVRAAGVDLLACGAQKWLLSPWGSGFLYVRRELVAQLEPRTVGWLAMAGAEDFSRMLDYDFRFAADARRFEVATIPYQDAAGMVASLGLLLELGPERVHARIAELTERLIAAVDDAPALTLLTPRDPDHRAGIVSFRAPDAAALSARLDAARVVHSLRGDAVVRLSPHVYNTLEEMERIAQVLDG